MYRYNNKNHIISNVLINLDKNSTVGSKQFASKDKHDMFKSIIKVPLSACQ